MSEIFRMAHTTESIDYNQYLNRVGYHLTDASANLNLPDLGLSSSVQNGRVMITSVWRGGSSWDGGLNVRDELIAIDGQRLDASGRDLSTMLNHRNVGDTVSVMVTRDGLIREFTVELKRSPMSRFSLDTHPNATVDQKRLAEIWLGSRN